MKLYREDIALAYELLKTGCKWKVVANGFGVHVNTLERAIKRAEKNGLDCFPSYGY